MLARAIAGRRIGVVAGVEPYVWSNGATIFVPPQGERQLLPALLVHAALMAAGSFAPRVMMRLVGRRQHAARYLSLEAARALRRLDAILPPLTDPVRGMLADVHQSTSPEDSLTRALDDLTIPQLPELLGVLRPSRVLRESGPAAALLAPSKGRRIQSEEQLDIAEADDDEDSDESIGMKLLSGLGSDNIFSRLLRDQILNAGRAPQAENGEGGTPLSIGGQSASRQAGTHAELAERPDGLAALEIAVQPVKAQYPEWDHERQRYRLDWTSVVEMDPALAAPGLRLDDTPDPALRQALARLGLGLQTHSRRSDGEMLDLRALIDMAVARRAGDDVDERVYQTRLKTAHELGVIVLLDASGSTAEASEKLKTIWDGQRRLAAQLVRGLEDVGDRVAAYGFRSYSRHDVRFLRLKEFHERFDNAARARLAALEPSGFTRLGAAVRHATHLAGTQAGTPQKLLLLISDGLPYEDGYDGLHAQQDTRKALAEAVAEGLACVCISVGTSTRTEELKALWGEASHMAVASIDAVGPQAEAMFKTALRAALEASHGGRGLRRGAPDAAIAA